MGVSTVREQRHSCCLGGASQLRGRSLGGSSSLRERRVGEASLLRERGVSTALELLHSCRYAVWEDSHRGWDGQGCHYCVRGGVIAAWEGRHCSLELTHCPCLHTGFVRVLVRIFVLLVVSLWTVSKNVVSL